MEMVIKIKTKMSKNFHSVFDWWLNANTLCNIENF
jgi:hypothetical protein